MAGGMGKDTRKPLSVRETLVAAVAAAAAAAGAAAAARTEGSAEEAQELRRPVAVAPVVTVCSHDIYGISSAV